MCTFKSAISTASKRCRRVSWMIAHEGFGGADEPNSRDSQFAKTALLGEGPDWHIGHCSATSASPAARAGVRGSAPSPIPHPCGACAHASPGTSSLPHGRARAPERSRLPGLVVWTEEEPLQTEALRALPV